MDGSSPHDPPRQPPAVARAPDGAARPGGWGGGGRHAPPPLDSASLLGGRAEVEIRHGDETYRLRQTRAGKLILTK